MMAVIAAMVLAFPTRRAAFYEAHQRVLATFYGSATCCRVRCTNRLPRGSKLKSGRF